MGRRGTRAHRRHLGVTMISSSVLPRWPREQRLLQKKRARRPTTARTPLLSSQQTARNQVPLLIDHTRRSRLHFSILCYEA
mmetsp:Transcript_7081/g.21843  ORF Transcript_7081/g.21843 Transcript_7081/m.21843 type:complete len:81 (-) Transcript_7081:46-288(-)